MRPATCHPSRPYYAKGKCRNCYIGAWNRQRYKIRREAGLPHWLATGRTPAGWLRHLKVKTAWQKAHPETGQRAWHKYRAKMVRLYGGRPNDNFMARFRWQEAKEAKKQAARQAAAGKEGRGGKDATLPHRGRV